MSNVTLTPVMREIPNSERPREKLLRYGPDRLESRDLLALLLGTGTRSLSALGLADRLLVKFQSIHGIASASIEELTTLSGVGVAKAAQIVAAVELGRRLRTATPTDEPIRSAKDVVSRFAGKLSDARREEVWALLLDTKNRVIGKHVISIGHLSGAPVHPRELFHEAVRRSAASVIVVHNHPSGDPTPSPDDIALTKRLREAGLLIGIELLDHVVLGHNRYVSLRDSGYW